MMVGRVPRTLAWADIGPSRWDFGLEMGCETSVATDFHRSVVPTFTHNRADDQRNLW